MKQLCTAEQLKTWYPCECSKCGWSGCSGQLGEERNTEDVDLYCKRCRSHDVDDCENDVTLLVWLHRRIKMVLSLWYISRDRFSVHMWVRRMEKRSREQDKQLERI